MANRGARVGGRLIDLVLQVPLVVATWILVGDAHRIWTDLFWAFVVITAYETLTVTALGATVGQRLVGLRVVQLDRAGRPTAIAALRRGAATAALTVLAVIGWAWATVSTLGDALGRGSIDRVAATMVVPLAFAGPVATRDLPGYADGARPPRLSPVGRVGDLDVRFRARLRRLTDAPVLAAAIGLLALAVSLPFTTWATVLASSLVWIVAFVVAEARLVHRTGATPGHEMAGLVILGVRTGRPPTIGRSAARATVLGLLLYVPLLWPLLAASMLMIRFGARGRGLHDLAGGTVVVADPRLAPEAARQRAMRLRSGQVG